MLTLWSLQKPLTNLASGGSHVLIKQGVYFCVFLKYSVKYILSLKPNALTDLIYNLTFIIFSVPSFSRFQPSFGKTFPESVEVWPSACHRPRILRQLHFHLTLSYPTSPPPGLPLPWRTERGGGRRGECCLPLKIHKLPDTQSLESYGYKKWGLGCRQRYECKSMGKWVVNNFFVNTSSDSYLNYDPLWRKIHNKAR